jgi:hypothetical protein
VERRGCRLGVCGIEWRIGLCMLSFVPRIPPISAYSQIGFMTGGAHPDISLPCGFFDRQECMRHTLASPRRGSANASLSTGYDRIGAGTSYRGVLIVSPPGYLMGAGLGERAQLPPARDSKNRSRRENGYPLPPGTRGTTPSRGW